MANTCFTTYKCVSENPKDLKKLYQKLQYMDNRKTPVVTNGWFNPKRWLGCLVKALGGDPKKIYCRGEISDYELEDDVLTINTETAWSEMCETRRFIESVFPGLKIYYIEEEGDCEIYNTNDKDGLFFSDRYYLDSDGAVDEHYFKTIGELAEVISEIVGHPVDETFKECEKVLEDYMEENPDEWYSLHEFQICED